MDNITQAISLIDGLIVSRLQTELCASTHVVDALLDIRQLLSTPNVITIDGDGICAVTVTTTEKVGK